MTLTSEQQRAEELMAKGPVWLVRRVMELESFVADLEAKGLRADLNPTMNLRDVASLYSDWMNYLRRIDGGIRLRAKTALAAQSEGSRDALCPNCGTPSRLALAIDYDPFAEQHGLDQPGDQIRYCWKCHWSEPIPATRSSQTATATAVAPKEGSNA